MGLSPMINFYWTFFVFFLYIFNAVYAVFGIHCFVRDRYSSSSSSTSIGTAAAAAVAVAVGGGGGRVAIVIVQWTGKRAPKKFKQGRTPAENIIPILLVIFQILIKNGCLKAKKKKKIVDFKPLIVILNPF